MQQIWVYSVEAEEIEKICDDNDISTGYFIQLLMEAVDMEKLKKENDLI